MQYRVSLIRAIKAAGILCVVTKEAIIVGTGDKVGVVAWESNTFRMLDTKDNYILSGNAVSDADVIADVIKGA